MTAYEKLRNFAQETALLTSAASVLGWDQETYIPQKGVPFRARQIAWLDARAHRMGTGKRFLKLLGEAEKNSSALKVTEKANLREWRYEYERASRIPASFVAKLSETSSIAKQAWVHARELSDFRIFQPHLESLLDLSQRKAELLGYTEEPYDALLENYEKGANSQSISQLFSELAPQVSKIAQRAAEQSRSQRRKIPQGPYPIASQQALNREIAESLGFDFGSGRIDTTAHPFCTTLGPRDVRLTTRYDEMDFTSSLLGVLHEAGHGLYEQGLPEGDFGLPSGSASSLGIHESQSRLWENHVGKSEQFWAKWYPRAQALFPQLGKLSLPHFLRILHRVEFSPIRVEADEATYDLHIFLRFELERDMINGALKVADLPQAWNERFMQLFSFFPPDDSRGCLQDIHWSMGGFGYFATYTLGNLNAAQLFSSAMSDRSIAAATRNADYSRLLDWLRRSIHVHGCNTSPQALMKSATGSETQSKPYLKHLTRRFL
jgi:carboxypeptidase Taq